MKETMAYNVKGMIIKDYSNGERLFRVYNNKNDTFVDYKIKCDDLEVTISDKCASLYSNGILDYCTVDGLIETLETTATKPKKKCCKGKCTGRCKRGELKGFPKKRTKNCDGW